MHILFLTLVDIDTIYSTGIYADLIRKLDEKGHLVSVISPFEKRTRKKIRLIDEHNTRILKLRIGNTQKTNFIEKGVSTVMIGPAFRKAMKQYFSDIRFDLVLYSTPPITFVSAIEYVKKRDQAKTYLLLKDIFPQNAVDIGLMSTTGIKGILYRHFRRQEKKLYRISDRIGCMSQANAEYVIKHNSEINPRIVEICPNGIEVIDMSLSAAKREQFRIKYGIPLDKRIFVYGGNLGKPQGIPFLIECLKKLSEIDAAYFLIIGDGTEYSLLENYVNTSCQKNVKLMNRLSKMDFDIMVAACDVGMIFLDHRFTIPNFPSRLLSYMAAKLPVLAVTDPSTDLGKIIVEGEFGWWCESDNADRVVSYINEICSLSTEKMKLMGNKSYEYALSVYHVNDVYRKIIIND